MWPLAKKKDPVVIKPADQCNYLSHGNGFAACATGGGVTQVRLRRDYVPDEYFTIKSEDSTSKKKRR